jgi:hypothetical protein
MVFGMMWCRKKNVVKVFKERVLKLGGEVGEKKINGG